MNNDLKLYKMEINNLSVEDFLLAFKDLSIEKRVNVFRKIQSIMVNYQAGRKEGNRKNVKTDKAFSIKNLITYKCRGRKAEFNRADAYKDEF